MAGPLLPVESALTTVLAALPRCRDSESVALTQSVGRVLAEDLVAGLDVPPWDNSAVDGYAVRAAEIPEVPVTLPVSQRIAAGHPGTPLVPGTAARIFTGAPLPPGADSVVLQESTQAGDGHTITLLKAPRPGDGVRCRGEDLGRGQLIFARGLRLRTTDLATLAAVGQERVPVTRPLKVALLTTGDELVPVGQPLGPGQIHNTNAVALAGLVQALGHQCQDVGTVADDPQVTREALLNAAAQADCIITSGGVSVGEADHVRDAIAELGALTVWRLAIKPGKPFAFGRVGATPLFGLPGNPVSAFVTFLLLVRPALLTMAGATRVEPMVWQVPAGFARPVAETRQEYLRVRLDSDAAGQCCLIPYNAQGSAISASLSWADGLAVVAPQRTVSVGDLLPFLPFADLLN